MKNALLISLFLWVGSFAQTKTKEKTIGNLKGYNLTVKVTSDKSKKANAFHCIVNQSIKFRQQQKTLATKLFTLKAYDGYAISDIRIVKYKKQLYYELAFYRSNGSPEIYELYNTAGEKLAKCTAARDKTTYAFFRKSVNSGFFTESELVKSYDLIEFWE